VRADRMRVFRPGPIAGTESGQRLLHHATAASASAPPEGMSVPAPGDRLPAFTLTDLDGHPHLFPEDFAGRPLLINVWASWCVPCLSEMPELERFARAQGQGGVQVFGIALDDVDAVREFLREIPISYPVAVDSPGPADAGVRVGNVHGILPYTVLVSADGRLVRQKIGPFMQGETDAWARADSP